jgi:protein-disulfide isomerase
VLAVGGRRKFFEYLDRAFERQADVAAGRALDLAKPLGLDSNALLLRAESKESGEQVLRDVTLADRLQVPATPHYRLNGRALTGARAPEELITLIDAELREAEKLRAAGTAADAVYAARVRVNLQLPEPE